MRKYGRALHDQSNATFISRNKDGRLIADGPRVADSGPVKLDGSNVGLEQAGDGAQQGRLARS